MKKLLFLSIAVTIILIFCSCDESVGYDPDAIIVPVESEVVEIGESTPNQYAIPANYFYFKEEMDNRFSWEWKYDIVQKKLMIDTTATDIILWMDMEFINSKPDYFESWRNNKVHSFRFKFTAKLGNVIYMFSNNQESKHWAELEICYKSGRSNTIFDAQTVKAQVSFYEIDKDQCKIKGYISATMRNIMDIQTKDFIGLFTLYYKDD